MFKWICRFVVNFNESNENIYIYILLLDATYTVIGL